MNHFPCNHSLADNPDYQCFSCRKLEQKFLTYARCGCKESVSDRCCDCGKCDQCCKCWHQQLLRSRCDTFS